MPFEARNMAISDIFSKSKFEIPRNQRRYVWDLRNWKELLDDIIFVTESSSASPHFIGSIVLKDQGKSNDVFNYTIIDGQQRLTTLTLILVAILKILQERDMKDDYEGTKDLVLVKNIKNEHKSVMYSEYNAALQNIVEKMSTCGKKNNKDIKEFLNEYKVSEKKDGKIVEAIKFFYDNISRIIDQSDNPKDAILEIRNTVINMTLVRIVATSEEDSYTIFEILNARGQDLEDYELIKNYIMRYIEPDMNRDLAKIIWEEMESSLGSSLKKFIFHYVRHRFDTKSDNKESDYQIIRKNTKKESKNDLLDDMRKKSEYYLKLVEPSYEGIGRCQEFEYDIFKFFKSKQQEQFRPLLLSLMSLKESKTITDDLYKETIQYLYNFFVCYNIIGKENSNKLQDIVNKYAYALERNYVQGSIDNLLNDIKKKIPGYKLFEQSFSMLGWSDHYPLFNDTKNKNRVKVVLEIIEKHLSKRNVINAFTIEHAKPDSASEANAYIGNLLPLEEKINAKCKNKPLKDKLVHYADSNFKTPRSFSELFKNKEFDVQKRTKYLANLVYKDILGLEVDTVPKTKTQNISNNLENTEENDDNIVIPDGVYTLTRIVKGFGKVNGKALVKNGVFTVLKGSICANPSRKYVTSERRKAKIINNVLEEDIICKTPSSAGFIILGKNNNGWTEWKNENGIPINKFRK